MAKKEVFVILFIIIAALALFLLSGCLKKTEVIVCEHPSTVIGERCCFDTNNNTICDDQDPDAANITGPAVCGNNICENKTEDCKNCWKDCGACKKIVYIYIPRNFTLAELTQDLNALTRDGIKFRKDIYNSGNISNFFYFDQKIPRYFAEFMDVKYKFLYNSRQILLNNILNKNYYVNDSASLLRFVNASNWYFIHNIRIREQKEYDNRITTNKAKEDYPTPPTGYQKLHRYAEWEFRNHTKEEDVLANNVTLLDNGMVESVYAGITDYDITYKTSEYVDKDPDDPTRILEDFRSVEEMRLTNIHTISFRCARNLVITLYEYDYDKDYYGVYYKINKETLKLQLNKNRAGLISRAKPIRSICDKKYRKEVFVYT